MLSPTCIKTAYRENFRAKGRQEKRQPAAAYPHAQSLTEALRGHGVWSHAWASLSNSSFNLTFSLRAKFCFPPRFTTDILNRQLPLLLRTNYQFCDPESSISEIFLRSSSSYSLFNTSFHGQQLTQRGQNATPPPMAKSS